MSQDLETTLQQLGLDEKQATVYLDLLQVGKDTAFNIAKRTKLKRSTVYVKLDELNLKSLVEPVKTAKTTLYRANTPKKILDLLDFRKKQAEEVLPTLLSLYKSETDRPRIQIYEGADAVSKVYEEAMSAMSDGGEILTFGTVAFMKEYGEAKIKSYIKMIRGKKYKARELLGNDPLDREYASDALYHPNPNHEVRVVNEKFENDNVIYGNKLAIFSVKQNLFVTVIEDAQIVDSYRKFFNLAWLSAKSLKD